MPARGGVVWINLPPCKAFAGRSFGRHRSAVSDSGAVGARTRLRLRHDTEERQTAGLTISHTMTWNAAATRSKSRPTRSNRDSVSSLWTTFATGTASAAVELIRNVGGAVAGASFIVELSFLRDAAVWKALISRIYARHLRQNNQHFPSLLARKSGLPPQNLRAKRRRT